MRHLENIFIARNGLLHELMPQIAGKRWSVGKEKETHSVRGKQDGQREQIQQIPSAMCVKRRARQDSDRARPQYSSSYPLPPRSSPQQSYRGSRTASSANPFFSRPPIHRHRPTVLVTQVHRLRHRSTKGCASSVRDRSKKLSALSPDKVNDSPDQQRRVWQLRKITKKMSWQASQVVEGEGTPCRACRSMTRTSSHLSREGTPLIYSITYSAHPPRGSANSWQRFVCVYRV